MPVQDAILQTMGKLGEAFGGKGISPERARALWDEILDEDAVWEAPFVARPVRIEGRKAVGMFFEWLLEMVPNFTTELRALHVTEDPNTIVIESAGGGPVRDGGVYDQRYCTVLTFRDGRFLTMREHFNPLETYRAFGEERFHAAIDDIIRRAATGA